MKKAMSGVWSGGLGGGLHYFPSLLPLPFLFLSLPPLPSSLPFPSLPFPPLPLLSLSSLSLEVGPLKSS